MEGTFFIAVLTGLGLGLESAIQPGPLMAVILGESLRGGVRRGVQFGLIPLITDPIMIVFALILAAQLPPFVMGLVSLAGAGMLVYYGKEGLRKTINTIDVTSVEKKTYFAAVGMNFFNPNLYLYAFTVHITMITAYREANPQTVGAYLISYFAAMVAVNSLLAWISGSYLKQTLSDRIFNLVSRYLSYLLFGVAALFVLNAIKQFLR